MSETSTITIETTARGLHELLAPVIPFADKGDSYVLEWMPSPGHQRPVGAEPYYGNRGYWDNLWVRVRDSDQRLDSVPRRGYLEVILDGYR